MDDLGSLLNCCNTGCVSGDTIINHLKYADDLVLISPSATGMKLLLCACEAYSLEHALVHNSKKSTALKGHCIEFKYECRRYTFWSYPTGLTIAE